MKTFVKKTDITKLELSHFKECAMKITFVPRVHSKHIDKKLYKVYYERYKAVFLVTVIPLKRLFVSLIPSYEMTDYRIYTLLIHCKSIKK